VEVDDDLRGKLDGIEEVDGPDPSGMMRV